MISMVWSGAMCGMLRHVAFGHCRNRAANLTFKRLEATRIGKRDEAELSSGGE
jgi:hypothetical protein